MTETQLKFWRELLQRAERMLAAMEGRLPEVKINAGKVELGHARQRRNSLARLVVRHED